MATGKTAPPPNCSPMAPRAGQRGERATGHITQETLLREFLRRKRLDPTLDVLKEIAKTFNEGINGFDNLNPNDPPPRDSNAPPAKKPN